MIEEEFQTLVTEVLDDLLSEILERMDNVAVTVAYWPGQARLSCAGEKPTETPFGIW